MSAPYSAPKCHSSPSRVDQDFNFHPKCFDIPIEIEDPLKSKMANIVQSFEGEEGKEIVKLEDNVGELAYFARDLKQKRDFLESFAYVYHTAHDSYTDQSGTVRTLRRSYTTGSQLKLGISIRCLATKSAHRVLTVAAFERKIFAEATCSTCHGSMRRSPSTNRHGWSRRDGRCQQRMPDERRRLCSGLGI